MNKLKVKLLHPDAKAPTIGHPDEDLAYDLYALESAKSDAHLVCKIRTGIAANAYWCDERLGLILKTRSGMAAFGFTVEGGVIDSRYTGEIIVLLSCKFDFTINAGDKIAQAVPVKVLTGVVEIVEELEEGARGAKGFGSTGR